MTQKDIKKLQNLTDIATISAIMREKGYSFYSTTTLKSRLVNKNDLTVFEVLDRNTNIIIHSEVI